MTVVGLADGPLTSFIPASKTTTMTSTMTDLLLTLSLLGGLIGVIIAVAWTTNGVFSWIGNRLPWRRPPDWVVGSSLSTAPLLAIDPYRAAYQLALSEWGTKITDTGDERGMGWNELLFQIDPAVAGVFEVLTVLGEARFTPGLRCMVIVDRETITALDRQQQRGVCLAADWPRQGLRMNLEDAIMTIHFFETVDSRSGAFTEKSFSVDLHAEQASALLPPGWPGRAVLLPQPDGGRAAVDNGRDWMRLPPPRYPEH